MLLLLIHAVMVSEAHGDWNTTFIPTAGLGLEYDSNVFFENRNEDSSFSYRGDVSIPFRAETTASTLGLSYRGSYNDYFSFSDVDEFNQFINFDASHDLTRRLRLSFSDGYSIIENADRVLASQSSEGETGIIFRKDDRKANFATASANYSLTQKSSLRLSYTNSFYRFDRPESYDSKSNSGTVSYYYGLNPQNTFFATASARKSDYDRSDRQVTQNAVYTLTGFTLSGTGVYRLSFTDEFDESKVYSGSIGWEYDYSPTLSLTLSVGATEVEDTTELVSLVSGGADIPVPHSLPVGSLVQYTVFGASPQTQISPAEFNGIVVLQNVAFNTTDDSKKNSGLIYDLNVQKTFSRSSLTMGVSRNTQQRGSQGGTSLRDAVNVHYNYRFSDRLSAFLRGLYTRNRTDEEFFDDEYETYRAGVGADYRITRNLTSSLYWYHTEQTRDLESASTGPRTERDIVSLLFTYEWNLMR